MFWKPLGVASGKLGCFFFLVIIETGIALNSLKFVNQGTNCSQKAIALPGLVNAV
jgi:hypothetical protein